MPGILTIQPVKALWVLLAVAINAIRFPLWILYYIPPFMRPHPHWSFRQSISVQVVKSFLWNAAMVEMKTPISLLPRAERAQWAVAKTADKKFYTGVALADPKIVPDSIGGTWYPAKPAVSGKPGIVVLHFHGGAYVIGDGRIRDAGFAAKTILANTDATHVFAPQYRLSCNRDSRFPAALQDAITAYLYLIQVEGILPNKIVISGDSAGANLALALDRYIVEYGASLPIPGPMAALLWSPWVNLNKSLTSEAFNNSPHVGTDYITQAFGHWGATAFCPTPSSGLTLDSPYISAGTQPHKTPTPIHISTGECEVLFHDDVELAENLKKAGNQVSLQVEEHCVHDTILTGRLMGFEKEAAQGAKRAQQFLKKVQTGVKF